SPPARTLFVRFVSPGQQEHEVALKRPRGPDLLPVDDVGVTASPRAGADTERIQAGIGLGDPESLKSQLSRCDRWKPLSLLLLRSVSQDSAHDVHLGMARPAVRAGAVDLLHDDRGLRDTEPRAAVLGGDQSREPTRLGERRDEILRVGLVPVDPAPVLVGESGTQLAHATAKLLLGDVTHGESPPDQIPDVRPPSTTSAVPVTQRASSEAR